MEISARDVTDEENTLYLVVTDNAPWVEGDTSLALATELSSGWIDLKVAEREEGSPEMGAVFTLRIQKEIQKENIQRESGTSS
ncbi:MAG: hypothetical protein ACXQS2_00140 [Methermicoccaceae archaeon]